MTPDELRQQIELQVVEFLKTAMESGAMKEERGQQISEIVLRTLSPGMNFEELYRAIPKLDDNCPELAPLVLPILRDYENTVNKHAMESIVELIRQGQYDAAAKLGKQAVSQEIKLEWHGSSDS
jgi:hypothetical protein